MDKGENQDESALLLRCKNGDKEAFGYIVRKYMKQAYFSALGFVASHEDALDLSQEAFVRAYRSISSFQTSKKFFTWYYRILRNLCLNHLRDKSRHAVPLSSLKDAEEIPDSGEGRAVISEVVEQEDLREKVWEALWNLESDEREIIVARDFLYVPYSELAELLDCPIGTVMSRLYYARKKLREQLKGLL